MNLQAIRDIKAIDFHCHFGQRNAPEMLEKLHRFSPSGVDYLLKNMELSNIAISVSSHNTGILPRSRGNAVLGNDRAVLETENAPGAYLWAIVDPLQPDSFRQAEDLLQNPKFIGIKLHPEEHCYPITKFGGQLYEFAARNHALIDTHSGEPNSMPEDFCFFANRFPEVTTIISHLGCGYDGDKFHQVRAIQQNINDNLYTDTSSMQSINSCLIELAVQEIGSRRILFGTDGPSYFTPCQRARIDCAHIPDEDKKNILYRNGLSLVPRLQPIYESLGGIVE